MFKFKNTAYSVGAIYLVSLNLPREDHFKGENMILVGLIPGPKEPSLNINVFLDPLVDELQTALAWHSFGRPLFHQVYRAALLCHQISLQLENVDMEHTEVIEMFWAFLSMSKNPLSSQCLFSFILQDATSV